MPSDENDRAPGSAGAADESFLRRWSRRKQQTASEQAPAPPTGEAADETPELDPEARAGDPQPPEDAAEQADLPDPSTLPPDSDFSAYLTGRVSSHLKRAAMRRLFSSPEFNVKDGLDDYDDDYTQFESLGDTVTAHMRHHEERRRKRDEEAAERAEAERPTEAAADTAETEEEAESQRSPESAPQAADAEADHSPEREARRDDPLDEDDTT